MMIGAVPELQPHDCVAMARYGWFGCFLLAFAVIIGWELHVPAEALAPAGLPSATAANATAQKGTVAAERAERAKAALSKILQRPLFHADRRPVVLARAVEPAGDAPIPRLAGIIVTPSTRAAIFAESATSKAAVVVEGDSLGLVKVVKIEASEVTVQEAGSVRVLRPALQALTERPAPVAVPLASNTVTTAGATFGAIPVERLTLLRNNTATFLQKLRTRP